MVRIVNNRIFCEKHRGWFFSSKYAKTGELPDQCPICKRLDWTTPKRKR